MFAGAQSSCYGFCCCRRLAWSGLGSCAGSAPGLTLCFTGWCIHEIVWLMARTTFAHTTHGSDEPDWASVCCSCCCCTTCGVSVWVQINMPATLHPYPHHSHLAASAAHAKRATSNAGGRRTSQDARLVTQKFSGSPHEALKLTNILGKNAS